MQINSDDLPPSYSFKEVGGLYQVVVKMDQNFIPDQASFIKEAQKSSLFGVAYLQELARQNHQTAQHLTFLYQGYRQYFEDRHRENFLNIVQQVLNDPSVESLAQEAAQFIKDTLIQIPTPDTQGSLLIEQLIPGFKAILTLPIPLIVNKEELVKIPALPNGHHAFPDLIHYQGRYFLTFREGQSHVGYQDYGKIRILEGIFDKEQGSWGWSSIGLLAKEPYDLRDPKFFVDRQGQLRLIFDGSIINEQGETVKMVPHVASFQEEDWVVKEAITDPSADGPLGQWIWRVTWNERDQEGYGFAYGKRESLPLVRTKDGVTYEKIAEIFLPELNESLTEGTIRFKEDGTAYAFIRTQRHGLIGVSTPESDYTDWSFRLIPFRVGGPNFVFSADESKIWAATRHFFLDQNNCLDEATVVGLMDQERFVPLLRLQSSYDNSYPGMVLDQDGSILIAYYSSTADNHSQIYITRIKPTH